MKNADRIISLTKENFWNEAHSKYPLAIDQFCKWIDEYKKKIDWNKLFNKMYHEENIRRAPNGEICNIDFSAPKFHDLPFDMQRGILTRYFEETIPNEDCDQRKRECIEGCEEFFEEQNKQLLKQLNP